MRIVFLGTPKFAIPSLEKLVESRHEVVAVVTQLDKPAGRGKKMMPSPVKEFAKSHGIKVLQFEKISRDGIDDLSALKPDIMITAAYGQILSQAIINIAKFGVINVHGSLLPKYRGSSPIQTAVLNGDSKTGITIMQTEVTLDTGDILSTETTNIDPHETAGELSQRLSVIGANLLLQTLDEIENGTVVKTKQQHADATITKKITKEDCLVNFNKSAKQVRCLVLGSNPSPSARAKLNGETILIHKAFETDFDNTSEAPGTFVEPTSAKAGAFVQCGQGIVEIIEAQFPGGKILSGKQLVGGRKFALGMSFEPITFPADHEE